MNDRINFPSSQHDCLPRVNSGDVSVVEERPGLCCALYNLCCFRETPRISPKRKNEGPPPSIPIVHRFSFPTSTSHQRTHTSPAVAPGPAARPPAPRDDQPREPPRKTSPNRPQLPRKLPGRPRDSDDGQDARPNFASGPRRPQLPRKLPFRPDDSADGPQSPRKFPNRPRDSDRPQPNRPNSSDRPQFLRKTDSDEPQISNRAEGPGQEPARKIKVRPRPQQRNDVEPERGEAEELPAPVQTVEQEDRRGQSGAEEISVEPRGETAPLPVPPAVDRTPKIISVEERPAPQQAEAVVIEPEEELAVDDFVLLPNPLTEGQVAEPAEAVTPPPANSPLDIPTYLPIEIPQDTSAPTYLPLDAGDVFEAPQLPPEEFQEAPEPSEAPAGSPQPFPSSLPEPEEAQSRGPIDVPAPPAAATTGRGTRTRGRARGSSSRGASDNGGGAVRTRSRSRSQG